MPEIILKEVGDTEGGNIIVRSTPFNEIGVISTGKMQGIYWYKEDTDKVIDALNKLKEVV